MQARGAAFRVDQSPLFLRGGGGIDGGLHVEFATHANLADRLQCGRVEDFTHAGIGQRQEFGMDEA
ncbi:hypothetical protein D3C84_1307690 [compost metagenome]